MTTHMAKATESFTVGVFKDLEWAGKAFDALERQGFDASMLSVLVRDSPEAAGFVQARLGVAPDRVTIARLGTALVAGSLVDALNGGDDGLARVGIAATMRRAGFQEHDGQIYERLADRGGLLLAVHDEPRAADALAVFLFHGGANAAIGAWRGRV